MNDRPYLSIGEVLELLKHDFPDLSISRIRAFESAGQLELERTASGYRKFYESDISFLRGLLGGTATRLDTQNHLAAAMKNATESAPVRGTAGRDPSADEHDEPLELGPNGELPGDPERRHPAAFQSLRRELAQRSPSLPPLPAVPPLASPPPVVAEQASSAIVNTSGVEAPEAIETPVAAVVEATPDPVLSAPPVLTVVDSPSRGAAAAAASATVETAPPSQSAAAVAVTAATRDTEPLLGSRNPLAADASGLNLSLDELVKASGLTNETIRELESLGLLKGQGVFSAVYYDEDALLTCKLVASFKTYGVEPRHLRMYKLAADREASFFEQVVTPQLRRRNPDARQSAIDTLGELVRLGEQLRIVALRQVLRSSINR